MTTQTETETGALIRVERITETRDLRPGDLISQEYLKVNPADPKDEGSFQVRQIRLDRVQSAYLTHVRDGEIYLSPVIRLSGWDVRRGQPVEMLSAPRRPWAAIRAE